ncbi:MAG: nitric oxide reductase activation protein [Proteobacteria bacterium]|nr:nitric oxide reductase activation protein [Pseudomonadota bacterium]
MPRPALRLDEIIERLDIYFDTEFTFIKSEEAAALIIDLPRSTQDFVLELTRRVASTNEELAFQFSMNANRALDAMDLHMVEAWAMTATDNYDRKGLLPAMSVIRELDSYVHSAHINACGAVLDEEIAVLLPFVQGLSGRKLKIAEADGNDAYTDTETIYLPAITALLEESKDNFLIYKATIAMLWAQIHFGTFRVPFERLQHCDNPESELKNFSALENIRLESCIKRELPGLYRDMQLLKKKVQQQKVLQQSEPAQENKNQTDDTTPVVSTPALSKRWLEIERKLTAINATIDDTLNCLALLDDSDCPAACCYQGILQLDRVSEIKQKRIEKEKAYFRIALSELAKESLDSDKAENEDAETAESIDHARTEFKVKPQQEDPDQQLNSGVIELELEGELVALPDHVRELITSIIVDFGEIPPEHLFAAGPGEYDLKRYEEEMMNSDDVWQGTYHEEGAELYNEWNFKRQHYHKNWCVLRELEIEPEYDDFVEDTLLKYKGLLKSLRHTFEILRGEDKLLKKQVHGDDVDIDALVEAYADLQSGMEMTDRLFTKMHKVERNVAVIFMVDMSGSTKGWINEAERESLILLAEVLQILGDRFAIYGFSGMTRKRCELYRIKTFDEEFNDEVKGRISNMKPKDYTRMGVFIRHMTRIFSEVEASTKLLITLSDGKPDDYDTYRGEYGVEDTRQALYEAHRDGIHSYCITIDDQARDYLPHMYGAANYSVISEVGELPMKVADIYRRLTT